MANKSDKATKKKPAHSAPSSGKEGKRRKRNPFIRFLRLLVVLLILCIAGITAAFIHSYSEVTNQTEQIIAQYATLKQQLTEADAEHAMQTASQITNDSNRLKAKANSFTWDIVRHIPLIGGSAQSTSTCININALLATHLTEPYTAYYKNLVTSKHGSEDQPFVQSENNVEAASLVAAVEHAIPTLNSCSKSASNLKSPLLPKSKKFITQQQETLASLEPAYANVVETLENAPSIGEGVAKLLPY